MKTRLPNPSKAFTRAAIGAMAALSLAPAALASFDFPDFTTTDGLTLVGDAVLTSPTIAVTPALDHRRGGVWYTASKQLVDQGFDTRFKIRVFDRHRFGADGFAFIIQNSAVAAPIGSAGGGIGYADNIWYEQIGIPNSLAVEVDLWNNTDRGWDDFGGFDKHISIQSRGQLTNSPDQSASLGAAGIDDLGDGLEHEIRVTYANNSMSVYVDGVLKLTAPVNLATLLALDNGSAWVGITAATGSPLDQEGHELRSWSFTEIPAPSAAAILGLGGLLAARRRRA